MPKAKGRPFSDNPRNVRLEIRLTKEQAELLNVCADRMGTTKTAVLMKGLELVKDELGQK